MRQSLLRTMAFLRGAAAAAALGGATFSWAAEFQPPVRMQGGDQPIRVEAPGFAAPAWTDVDGDGAKDLLVGQFNSGKIRVYRNLGGGKLAAGEWLMAEGAPAEIPGVW